MSEINLVLERNSTSRLKKNLDFQEKIILNGWKSQLSNRRDGLGRGGVEKCLQIPSHVSKERGPKILLVERHTQIDNLNSPH